jgi:hypothetical protein
LEKIFGVLPRTPVNKGKEVGEELGMGLERKEEGEGIEGREGRGGKGSYREKKTGRDTKRGKSAS